MFFMFWKHYRWALTCLFSFKWHNSVNVMWCFKSLFVNEETEATKVQWLDKVRAGEWWVMYVKSRYPESNIQLSSLTGEGCLVPDSSRTRTVGSLSACLSLLPVSLFTQHLYSPLSLFPFPSFLYFSLDFGLFQGGFVLFSHSIVSDSLWPHGL